MREDIVAGLKNAFERGESMEKAVNAFINAGYNQNEVEEAAKSLGFLYSQQQTPQSSSSEPAQQNQQKLQFQPLPVSPSLTREVTIPIASSSDSPKKQNSAGRFKMINILLGGIVLLLILGIIGFFAWKFLKGG